MNDKLNTLKNQAKKAWNENPKECVIIGIAATMASAKIISATAEARNARTWKKEVDRRDRNSRR